VISEVQHNELNMNEDSNETMNEDKEAAGQQLGFLSQRVLKKVCNASGVFKIKNVKLVNVL
jgi:hypothetical protein